MNHLYNAEGNHSEGGIVEGPLGGLVRVNDKGEIIEFILPPPDHGIMQADLDIASLLPIGKATSALANGAARAGTAAKSAFGKAGSSIKAGFSRLAAKTWRPQTLSKSERVKIIVSKINKIKAKDADHALKKINKIVDKVEDSYSGVKRVTNPGKAYKGRMYGPRSDSVIRNANGSIIAKINKGNIHISSKGRVSFF